MDDIKPSQFLLTFENQRCMSNQTGPFSENDDVSSQYQYLKTMNHEALSDQDQLALLTLLNTHRDSVLLDPRHPQSLFRRSDTNQHKKNSFSLNKLFSSPPYGSKSNSTNKFSSLKRTGCAGGSGGVVQNLDEKLGRMECEGCQELINILKSTRMVGR